MRWLARLARRLRRDEHGTVAVETVLIAPLLILGLFFSYEAYGLFRQQSLREKATYTVADILSRETAIVDDTYIDNVKRVFDMMSGTADSQLRISVVRYRNDPSQGIDEFDLRWSEVRGTGTMTALTDSVVRNAHDTFPIMDDGERALGRAAAEIARAHLPDQVTAMLAVKPRDRALAGGVGESADPCPPIERLDGIGRQRPVGHARDVERRGVVRFRAVRPADAVAEIMAVEMRRRHRMVDPFMPDLVHVAQRAERAQSLDPLGAAIDQRALLA